MFINTNYRYCTFQTVWGSNDFSSTSSQDWTESLTVYNSFNSIDSLNQLSKSKWTIDTGAVYIKYKLNTHMETCSIVDRLVCFAQMSSTKIFRHFVFAAVLRLQGLQARSQPRSQTAWGKALGTRKKNKYKAFWTIQFFIYFSGKLFQNHKV